MQTITLSDDVNNLELANHLNDFFDQYSLDKNFYNSVFSTIKIWTREGYKARNEIIDFVIYSKENQ